MKRGLATAPNERIRRYLRSLRELFLAEAEGRDVGWWLLARHGVLSATAGKDALADLERAALSAIRPEDLLEAA